MMENRTNYDNNRTPSGPYRATKLWNEVIQAFRAGVTCGRHRRYMRTHEDCFTTSSAIDWLHDYLKNNPNFGSNVTRSQTVQLLDKLYKAKVFEDVGSSKNSRGRVADNGLLYRFCCRSPVKSVNRVPLTCRSDLINNGCQTELLCPIISKSEPPPMVVHDFQKHCEPEMKLEECHLVAKKLAASDIEEIWTDITIDRLKTILGAGDLDDILDSNLVSGKNIVHNCTIVNKNGIVTGIESKDQLPPWAMSAMKCLARWPEKLDDKLPSYVGFEKDVFRVVTDYFSAQAEPLMTYELFEVITNIFMRGDESCVQQQSTVKLPRGVSGSMSFKSVENFLLDLTSDATQSCNNNATEDYALHSRTAGHSALDLSPVFPTCETTKMYRTQSLTHDLPYTRTRYETAFGPENQTITRVYYADETSSDKQCSEPDSFKTVMEQHYTSPRPVNFVESAHRCQATYGVNFARVRSIRKKRKSTSDTPCNTSDNRKEVYGCAVAFVRPRYGSTPVHDCAYSQSRHDNSFSYYSTNMSLVSDQSNYKTPPSRANQLVSPNCSCRTDPPKYQYPPCYESVFANGYEPVISGNKKHRKNLPLSGTIFPKSKDGRISDCFSSRVLLPQKVEKGLDNIPYRSMSTSDLTINSAFTSNLTPKSRSCSTKSVYTEDKIEQNVKALQIVCLFLPPANRRKLQLLMRLVAKMVKNTELCLDSTRSTNNLVVETFYHAILCSQDEVEIDEILVKQIVSFLMDNHLEILSTPVELKNWVDERICLKKTQIVYSSDDPSLFQYCTQVSSDDYEKQKLNNSQQALVNLLNEIVSNQVMSHKDKKKRLKQFQKSYPDLYARRFPNKEKESGSAFGKPKIKPPLLVKPLMKLKGLRI